MSSFKTNRSQASFGPYIDGSVLKRSLADLGKTSFNALVYWFAAAFRFCAADVFRSDFKILFYKSLLLKCMGI